jgi:hypothetical protein
MEEILPGVHHWSAYRETIGMPVHSHFFAPAATLFDPMVPDGGLDAVAALGTPERIVLSNRHHYRFAGEFAERFGCTVLCHEAGLHAFEDGRAVEGFRFGDELAPGVTALDLGALTPEEAALRIDAGPGALLFGDTIYPGEDGEISLPPDFLIGDDAEAVKRAMTARLTEVAAAGGFDALLFAHGAPVAEGGRAALDAFLAERA